MILLLTTLLVCASTLVGNKASISGGIWLIAAVLDTVIVIKVAHIFGGC